MKETPDPEKTMLEVVSQVAKGIIVVPLVRFIVEPAFINKLVVALVMVALVVDDRLIVPVTVAIVLVKFKVGVPTVEEYVKVPAILVVVVPEKARPTELAPLKFKVDPDGMSKSVPVPPAIVKVAVVVGCKFRLTLLVNNN